MNKISLFGTFLLFVSFLLGCGDDSTTDQPTVKTAIDYLTAKPWKVSKVYLVGDDITSDVLNDECKTSVSYTFRRNSKDLLINRALFHYAFSHYDTTYVKDDKDNLVPKIRTVNDTTYCWVKDEDKDEYSLYPSFVEYSWKLSDDNKSLILTKIFPKQPKDSVLTIKEITENSLILTSNLSEVIFKNN